MVWLSLAAFMLTNSAPMIVSALPSDIELLAPDADPSNPKHDAETTAVAIAPGEKPNCPKGRLIVSSGWRSNYIIAGPSFMPTPGQTTQLLITDLTPGAPTKLVNLPIPKGKVGIPGCDSILTKAANGDILFIYLYAVADPVTDPKYKPAFDGWKGYNEGWRCAFALWRSTDGGDTWTTPTQGAFSSPGQLSQITAKSPSIILDTANMDGMSSINGVLEAGEYAWPQTDKNKPWFGGYDREELYADPWHPNVLYITCGVRSGTAINGDGTLMFEGHAVYQNVLFSSLNGGATWSSPTVLGYGFNPPIMMTSVPPLAAHPQGRLYILGRGAHAPKLRWSDDFGKTFSSGVECISDDTNQDLYFGNVEPGAMPLSTNIRSHFALARGATNDQFDTVRVAYSGTKYGHQNIIVSNVIVRANGKATVESGTIISPQDILHGHILFPHFIETDQCGAMKAKTANSAVLAWIEGSRQSSEKFLKPIANPVLQSGEKGERQENKGRPSNPYGEQPPVAASIKGGVATLAERASDQVCTKAMFFGNATEHSLGDAKALGPISLINKQRRDWNPLGGFFGDYTKGAFFGGMTDGSLNFIVQYPSRRSDVTPQHVNYNVVSLHPITFINNRGGK